MKFFWSVVRWSLVQLVLLLVLCFCFPMMFIADLLGCLESWIYCAVFQISSGADRLRGVSAVSKRGPCLRAPSWWPK